MFVQIFYTFMYTRQDKLLVFGVRLFAFVVTLIVIRLTHSGGHKIRDRSRSLSLSRSCTVHICSLRVNMGKCIYECTAHHSLCIYRETFPLSVYSVKKIYIQNNNNNNTAYDEFKNEHIQVYIICVNT